MRSNCKINVFVRIRPLLPEDSRDPSAKISVTETKYSIWYLIDSINSSLLKQPRSFEFDGIISESSTQINVFETCQLKQQLLKFTKGYNLTILAYGQTGSGKTFTMEGLKYDKAFRPIIPKIFTDQGVTPRAISTIFENINLSSQKSQYLVFVSYLQIYKEKIIDLLEPGKTNLKLRWSQSMGFEVENLSIKPCHNIEEVLSFFYEGIKHKPLSAHNANKSSSRSHSIFMLKLEKISLKTRKIFNSNLALVDLAGSEKQSVTKNEGKALKESIEINKSLFALRQVIANISSNEKHIPYRESKLTSILKQSIGGNSYCVMIACISPLASYLEETISTLQYASKTHSILNNPVKNIDPKTQLVLDLQSKVFTLEQQLSNCYTKISTFTETDTCNESINIKLEKYIRAVNTLQVQNKDLIEKLEKSENEKMKIQIQYDELLQMSNQLKTENDKLKAQNKVKLKKSETPEMQAKKLWRFKSKRTILIQKTDNLRSFERSESLIKSYKKSLFDNTNRPQTSS